MQADSDPGGQNGPWRITFDTNPDDCNLACVMCEEHSDFSEKKRLRMTRHRRHRRMDVSLVRNVVAEMAGRGLREIIPSTMGEPLLYSHFDEIIQICRDYGVRLNLTTNGTWPLRGPVAWGRLLCPVASDVKISWNGVTPHVQDAIMKGDHLESRIEALKDFIAQRDEAERQSGNRCRVTLQCTFLETNLDELPALVRLASDIGVDRVKGHHLWVHFDEMRNEDLRRTPESRRRWNDTVRQCVEVAAAHPKSGGGQVLLENFLPLSEDVSTKPPADWVCPFLGQEAWVNHAGRFDPCCAPDLERQSLGYFGLVTESGGLGQIWHGAKYRTLVDDYRTMLLCQKCTMRRPKASSS